MKTNHFILISLDLPIYEKFIDISNDLRISSNLLYSMLKYKSRFYTIASIPKKNSLEMRKIYKPNYSLKLVQKFILVEILEKITTSKEAFAFKKNNKSTQEFYGIKYNAMEHIKNEYIYEFDLKNFFPSITKKKVFYLFINLGYNQKVANILAELCTIDDILPQGSVTAPYISNLICLNLDRKLKEKCDERGITYTRYADDLTFSSNDLEKLKEIKKIVAQEVKKFNFVLNNKKTRLMILGNKRVVTGILLQNKKLYVKKTLKKKVRSMIFNSIMKKDYSNLNKINGYISFISHIEEDYNEKISNYINHIEKKVIKIISDIKNDLISCQNYDDFPQTKEELESNLKKAKEILEKYKKNLDKFSLK